MTFVDSVERIQCINLSIIDDPLNEGNETITFSLSSTDDAVIINEPLQSFVLRDDDKGK